MELMRTSMRGSGRIRPGETALFALEAEPGLLSAALWSEAFFVFEISGERRAAPQTISVVIGPGACDPNEGSVTPGPVVINVRNETQRQAIFGILQSPPRAIEHGMLTFWPFLSGKRLLMTQTFRDTSARRSRQLPGPAASGCYRRNPVLPAPSEEGPFSVGLRTFRIVHWQPWFRCRRRRSRPIDPAPTVGAGRIVTFRPTLAASIK